MEELIKRDAKVSLKGRKSVGTEPSMIPWTKEDIRTRYLRYIVSGFSVDEALSRINRTRMHLKFWKKNDTFRELDNTIMVTGKHLAQEDIELEFYRNYRLVLEKDYQVLKRSLGLETKDGKLVKLSPYDARYLMKLRANYTAQQINQLESSTQSTFNFAEWVNKNKETVMVSRTDTITMVNEQEDS